MVVLVVGKYSQWPAAMMMMIIMVVVQLRIGMHSNAPTTHPRVQKKLIKIATSNLCANSRIHARITISRIIRDAVDGIRME